MSTSEEPPKSKDTIDAEKNLKKLEESFNTKLESFEKTAGLAISLAKELGIDDKKLAEIQPAETDKTKAIDTPDDPINEVKKDPEQIEIERQEKIAEIKKGILDKIKKKKEIEDRISWIDLAIEKRKNELGSKSEEVRQEPKQIKKEAPAAEKKPEEITKTETEKKVEAPKQIEEFKEVILPIEYIAEKNFENKPSVKKSEAIKKDIEKIETEILGLKPGLKKILKYSSLNSKKKNLEKEFIRIVKIEVAIEKDHAMKPFKYFTVGKITNRFLLPLLKNNEVDMVDLRYFNKSKVENELTNFIKTEGDEALVEYNTLGFAKIIKNINDTIKIGEGPQFDSPKAIYKIMAPNGKIVADNIKGYKKVSEIYDDMSKQYTDHAQNEFNDLNKVKTI